MKLICIPLFVSFSEVAKDSPARILDCVSRMTLNEGETLRLSCAATGHPTPSYRWFRVLTHSGQQNGLPPQPLRIAPSNQPQLRQLLVINKMTLADSASYLCVVNNSFGEDNCHTQVFVTGKFDSRKRKFSPRICDFIAFV